MLKIGITGGIGTGKSTVAKMFEVLGVPVYYADFEAKQLILKDEQVKSAIIHLLGDEAYLGKTYNVPYVKKMVLSDDTLLSSLNRIVHPAVAKHFDDWLKKYKNVPYIIKEAAIMNKSTNAGKIIFVSASESIRTKRILSRDPERSSKEIEQIMANQKSKKEFLEISDFVIYNNDEGLIPQVLEVHEAIIKEITS
jgi:dephospho-CoA kinase